MDTKATGTFRRLNFVEALRERARIHRLCNDLLRLNRHAATESQPLSDRERYAHVVEQHCGTDSSAAHAAVRRAEESFANWPHERALTLRDIAQYLAVTDCLTIDIAEAGVNSRFVDRVIDLVATFIPADA